MVPPIAAAAATPEPLMAPNSMLATTLVSARAPGILPLKIFAQFTSRMAIPPLFMIFPASMKKGIASSEKELTPVNTFCAAVPMAFSKGSTNSMAMVEARPMLILMGIPKTSMVSTQTSITSATSIA